MRWWWLGAVAGWSASPAMADWQYTKWGMSPEQVVAASGGAAAPADPAGVPGRWPRLVSGTYTIDGQLLDVNFHFDPKGLAFVKLSLRDVQQCSSLLAPLRNKYGQPETVNNNYGLSMKWRDTSAGNLVGYVDESGNHTYPSCTLWYRPIKNEVSDQL